MAKKAKIANAAPVRKAAAAAAKRAAKGGRKPKPSPSPGATAPSKRPTVRVYRQGLGDCILVTLPKKDGSDFTLMIDCGVAVATNDAVTEMTKVVDDIIEKTKAAGVDVLAVTHEHWDHVSGFQQAAESFKKLKVSDVWVAWTEDDSDPLAKKLRNDRATAFAAVTRSAAVRAVSGDPGGAGGLLQIAGMLGAAGEKTQAAFQIAKDKANPPKYLIPSQLPIDIQGTGARIYVLGPPHDEAAIKHVNPSKTIGEVYQLAMDGTGLLAAGVFTALDGDDQVLPFSASSTIPNEVAVGMPFFQRQYWGTPGDASNWRRIDSDWLGGTDEFALMLQAATNNTSLVLAIELAGGDVMLFAGDAQVGSWQSWQNLSWKFQDGTTVTGPDLLARTIFYKVGHHGSFNATLRTQGLEQMKKLVTAVIPVDEVVAKKMRWGAMPLTGLVDALNAQTSGRTFRTDKDLPAPVKGVTQDPLFFEFEI